jgi:hypothetical protein
MTAAEKLFEQMSRSKTGWKQSDLDTLYLGFGFTKREGGKHTIYAHPKYPHLREQVTRARDLPIGYVRDALKRIRELKSLEQNTP